MKKTIQTLVLSVATSTLLLAQAPATIPEKPEVIMVQGGSFQMGSNQETDEQPVHSVSKEPLRDPKTDIMKENRYIIAG